MTATNFFTGGMLSTNISVLATLLKEDIGLTSGQFGVIFAMSGIVTGLLGAFPGILIDKIGPKRGMILGYFLTWTPMVLFPLIQTPWPVFLALFFTAFGSSLNMPSTSAIVKALKITNFSKILGVNIVANSTGAFITQTFSPRLIPVMGGSWRNVIWLFTGITLMFGLFAISPSQGSTSAMPTCPRPPAALTRASRCPPSADAACGRWPCSMPVPWAPAWR